MLFMEVSCSFTLRAVGEIAAFNAVQFLLRALVGVLTSRELLGGFI
jgi:hypothetical protein